VIEPTKYDITIHQGATFELPVHYKDSNGNSVDMNGYTVAGMVYNRLGNTKLCDFTSTWTAQASGQFTLSIPSATTATMSGSAQYDVLVTEPDNTKFYLLEGVAVINPGLTGRP
jgi:hypothetical protein